MCLSKRSLLLLLSGLTAALLLNSCKQPTQERGYFNIDSLLQQQTALLAGKGSSLVKEAVINNKKQDTLIQKTDKDFWSRELELFSEIKLINRPLYRGRYVIVENLKEEGSNLKIREFRGDDSMPISYLKLFYQDNLQDLRKLEASFRDSTALLYSQRFFSMEFHELNSGNVLHAYTITGKQKLWLGDSVQYTVKAIVQHN